ncbi:MAG: c-type cytochrome [Saccharospirillum sp.]
MLIAWVLLALIAATVVLHFASPWWLTPLASNWGSIDNTINLAFWVTGIVFVLVNLFLVWVIVYYRYDKNRRAEYEPENKPLEGWLTVLTSIGVVAMLAPGLVVWANFVNVPESSNEVEALGQQWQWTYRFPGEDEVLGQANARFVTTDNPFGIDPEDPASQDDIIINSHRLHLPVDEPVKLVLRSNDVLHNFAVPNFRVKMDTVPGIQTYQWFTPSAQGTYDIMCMELCGLAHYTMRGQVIIEPRDAFDNWLTNFPTFAETQSRPIYDHSAGQALYASCAACHGADGSGNAALNAPNLTQLDTWYMERQMQYYRDGIRGSHPEDSWGRQMASIAPTVAEHDLPDLLGYIEQLPAVTVEPTLDGGNADNGQRLFEACAVCHGNQAQGRKLLGAPALAGQADWYLKRQLEHYSMGWRGRHEQDQFGTQMRLMTRTIQSPERLNDLLAYLGTLQ